MISYTIQQLDHIDFSSYYPDPKHSNRDQVWIRANFATSLNGVIKVDGKSDGVSGKADKAIFKYLRNHCDAIVVGASTAHKENYSVPRSNPENGKRPRLIIISKSLNIQPNAKFLDSEAKPLIVTSQKSLADSIAITEMLDGKAELVALGDETVELRRLKDLLLSRDYRTVLCEGGPTIFSYLLSQKLIDELCLTISPLIPAGEPTGIARLEEGYSTKLELANYFSVEGFLFCRYLLVKQ